MLPLLAVLLLGWPRPIAPAASVPVARADDLEAEFKELLARYENAFESYRFDLRQAKRAGLPEEDWPVHPSLTFYDRFELLAERGSPWAMSWMIENLGFRHSDAARQVSESKRYHGRLFREAPDHPSLLRVTRRMPTAIEALGRDYVLDELSGLYERSTSHDVKGNCLWAQGKAFRLASEREGDTAFEASIAMYEQLLTSHPGSPLAQDAALDLFPIYQGRLLAAMTAWMGELEALHAASAEPEAWPLCPLEPHRERMEPLAATGILQAVQWIREFYPRYSAARDEGRGPECWTLAAQFTYFQGALQGPWIELSGRLRTLCVRHFAGEAWLQRPLELLVNEVHARPYLRGSQGPLFEALAEVAKTDLERSAALFVSALLADRSGEFAELERALEGYRRIPADYPDSPWAAAAERLGDSLARAMPGQPFTLEGFGPHGDRIDLADHRGKVVLLDFFTFNSDACDERLRLEASLRERLADRPFELIGVCHDSLVKVSFDVQAEAHGITWPCISDLGLRRRLVADWHVGRYPTAFVIDEEGILRARNLSWDETVARIEGLFETSDR